MQPVRQAITIKIVFIEVIPVEAKMTGKKYLIDQHGAE
jgi:hypothetical protein